MWLSGDRVCDGDMRDILVDFLRLVFFFCYVRWGKRFRCVEIFFCLFVWVYVDLVVGDVLYFYG